MNNKRQMVLLEYRLQFYLCVFMLLAIMVSQVKSIYMYKNVRTSYKR